MASRHYNSWMATDKPTYPSDAAEKFIVRLPPGMREKIAESAKANGRSMNGEVIVMLERAFDVSPPDDVAMEAAELRGAVNGLKPALDEATRRADMMEKGVASQPNIIKTLAGLLDAIGMTTPGKTPEGNALMRKLSDIGKAFMADDYRAARKAYVQYVNDGARLHNRAVTEKWKGYENDIILPIPYPEEDEVEPGRGSQPSIAAQGADAPAVQLPAKGRKPKS